MYTIKIMREPGQEPSVTKQARTLKSAKTCASCLQIVQGSMRAYIYNCNTPVAVGCRASLTRRMRWTKVRA